MGCSSTTGTTGRYVIGVDLGGTKTAAGAVGPDGQVLFTDQIPTLNRDGGEAVLDATAALVRRVAGRLQEDRGTTAVAIGVGAAGVIDHASGLVLASTDAIAGWPGTDIGAGLSSRTGLAASVINDVHAHALGEAWQGAGRGAGSMLLAAIGTGVGGSLISGGQPLYGARSAAGHIGHVASPAAVGLPCSCGRTGHVEAIASGPALHQHFLRLGGDPSIGDARAVCGLAASAGPTGRLPHDAAHDAVTTAARAAGQALGGLANVLDPEIIVVSGGLAGAGSVWWDPMLDAARAELMDPLAGVPIVPARLGTRAAIIGAAQRALTSQSTADRC